MYKHDDNGVGDGKNEGEFWPYIVRTKQRCYRQSNSNVIKNMFQELYEI
jgi:hypothetical protein